MADKGLIGKYLKNLKGKWLFLLLALLGVLLLLFGGAAGTERGSENAGDTARADAYRASLEKDLTALCSRVSGVGKLSLMLTLESGETAVYGEAGESTLSRGQEKLLTHEYPRVRGVAVVCEGGNDPAVRQELTALLCAALGIGSHRVYIGAG